MLPVSVVKNKLKNWYRVGRRQFFRTFRSFDPATLERTLAQLGVARGDVVIVHCSYDGFAGFKGSVTDVIDCLQRLVGKEGAVLMPSQPFSGTAVDYARSNKVFDVKRTPSQMGILSELFRRSTGVSRSVHPTHSVAGWGGKAAALLDAHDKATTPCGRHSPYIKAADANGKVVFLGTEIDVMTYYHGLEEELEPVLPASPFTTEVFALRSKNAAGEIVETKTRLFDQALSRRRNMMPLQARLTQAGQWRAARVGTLGVAVVAMEDARRVTLEMARKGEFLYDV